MNTSKSPFDSYSAKRINQTIDDLHIQPACMHGVVNDLQRLKPAIEKLYADYNIDYLSYWKSECAYHGWDWSKDDGAMQNTADITDGITHRIEEIYALILGGLGERMETDDENS